MESEYRSLVTGAQESILAQNVLAELGVKSNIVIESDSSSAHASAMRRGVLHVKHLALRWLFVKELTEKGLIVIEKVQSNQNVADWLTKPVDEKIIARSLQALPSFRLLPDGAVKA